jgi:hypothetical protein
MGTNFYTLSGKHIGKRSAAGLYDWDCGISLRIGGEKLVHHSTADIFDIEAHKREWYDACPKCGQKPVVESLENSTLGRELGFNKGPFGKKSGVSSCSSFTWAVLKSDLRKVKKVKDEYGRKMTIEEFNEMLEECPIQFFDLVGSDFS